MALPPIHRAALEGDLQELNRLIEEDAGRLDTLVKGGVIDGWSVKGCTPLMLASYKGHDAVVARLIELGADVGLKDSAWGEMAAHWACKGIHATTLALLLNAGASLNARNRLGRTPLVLAAFWFAAACVKLLLARGGTALELGALDDKGNTALHYLINAEITNRLLQAGANPTIRNNHGETPLDVAVSNGRADCIPLLQAAMAEPQRPRLLLKARALLDAAIAIPDAADDARAKGASYAGGQRAALAAAPAYLKQRAEQGQELPLISMHDEQAGSEELVACLKYVLGLAYGGGVHFEGEEKPVGMLREVFVELSELLVPKWDRKNV